MADNKRTFHSIALHKFLRPSAKRSAPSAARHGKRAGSTFAPRRAGNSVCSGMFNMVRERTIQNPACHELDTAVRLRPRKEVLSSRAARPRRTRRRLTARTQAQWAWHSACHYLKNEKCIPFRIILSVVCHPGTHCPFAGLSHGSLCSQARK